MACSSTITFVKTIQMRFPSPVPIDAIASLINAEIIGDVKAMVSGINEIHRVEEGDLVFVDHPKYYRECIDSAASFIIINKEIEERGGKTLLVTSDPFEAYLKIVDHFRPFRPAQKMVSDTAAIGQDSVIMPGVFIGEDVRIGARCIIHPNVTIHGHCEIGDNVVIQSGSVIGSDAFYYNKKADREIHYKRMKSCGRVIIGDQVEVGAGCMIDRGVTHDTRIGRGTKMDNHIHVGHDTVIGSNCLIAAHVVIAGGVIIEDEVTIWGGVAINKTLTVGKKAVLLGRTGVTSSIEGGKTYWGMPAQEAGIIKRELVWIRRIPEIWEKLKK
jgi:UDP-3-O-[3-hydroxymyristoyl] glucosamine N-acyltransferase